MRRSDVRRQSSARQRAAGRETESDDHRYDENRRAVGWNAHFSNGNAWRVQQPVLVSGIGIVSVFGATMPRFATRCSKAAAEVVPVCGFDTTGLRTTIAGEIAGFDPSPGCRR
jgi:hypothetical protein